jgi:hypothetical protein
VGPLSETARDFGISYSWEPGRRSLNRFDRSSQDQSDVHTVGLFGRRGVSRTIGLSGTGVYATRYDRYPRHPHVVEPHPAATLFWLISFLFILLALGLAAEAILSVIAIALILTTL